MCLVLSLVDLPLLAKKMVDLLSYGLDRRQTILSGLLICFLYQDTLNTRHLFGYGYCLY